MQGFVWLKDNGESNRQYANKQFAIGKKDDASVKYFTYKASKYHFGVYSGQYTGNNEKAEQQFKMMAARFANYEARYYYSLMLLATDRTDEAHALLAAIIDEQPHLSSPERRDNHKWLNLAKGKLKQMAA